MISQPIRKKADLTAWTFGSFPLTVRRMNPQYSASSHFHDFVELVIIASGQGIHFTETESYPVAAGDVFVIRKRVAHGYSNPSNLRLINVLFYPAKLALPLDELDNLPGYHALFEPRRPARKFYGLKGHLCLDLKQLTQVEGLINALEQELKDRPPGFSFSAKALFMLIICFLSRYYAHRLVRAQIPLARISRAIAHLEANYAKPIHPADLAPIVHMSLRNLYRNFKSATGRSPIEYLIRLRVMRGAELLRRGELNVTEIAFQTGFNDGNYFSRVFQAVMGVTPGAFRKMQRW